MARKLDVLNRALTTALTGHRCVSGWLGYGRVLFLGFGPSVIPPINSDGRHSKPPYELTTDLAGWRIRGGFGADSDDTHDKATAAVSALIGRPVCNWHVKDSRSLHVEFDDGWSIDVVPPSNIDPDDRDLSEWYFFLPGHRYVGIGAGGGAVAGRTDRPFS